MALEARKMKRSLVVVIWTCFNEALNYLLSNCTKTTFIALFKQKSKGSSACTFHEQIVKIMSLLCPSNEEQV